MKIMCLIDSLASGGAERQMSYLASGLSKFGNDVKLVVFSEENRFYEDYIVSNHVNVDFDRSGLNRWKRIGSIVKQIRCFNPDVVISYKDGTNISACLAKLFVTFKLIVSERNTTQSLDFRERVKFLAYNLADVIVPNSYSQGKFIKTHYPKLYSKVRVVTNMIDTDTFKFCNIGKNEEGVFRFIVVGRVMAQKNVLRFIDAVSHLASRGCRVHFDWYGFKNKDYYPLVINKVRDLNVDEYISFLDPVSDIHSVLCKYDFFCLPSLYEGFPNVLCEAMCSGLPVTCSNVCDNSYIVEDGVNGFLFDPYNPIDIANKIESIILLPYNRVEKMRVDNSRKIIEMCSENKFINNYLNVINNVI